MTNKITKSMIHRGIKNGIVSFITDPNMDAGTVCKIGDYWFYFGGLEADEQNPEEYLKNVPLDDIVNEIMTVFDDFSSDPEFETEYLYYKAVLENELADKTEFIGQIIDVFQDYIDEHVDENHTIEGENFDRLAETLAQLLINHGAIKNEGEENE